LEGSNVWQATHGKVGGLLNNIPIEMGLTDQKAEGELISTATTMILRMANHGAVRDVLFFCTAYFSSQNSRLL